MRRTLTMVLVAVLVAGPALAYGPDDKDKTLSERAEEAAREVVAADASIANAQPLVKEPAVQEDSGGGGWKTVVGLALLGGGAGLITKGVTSWEEADRFGRTKNADSYVLFGLGGGFMAVGALMVMRGLSGDGFN